ncbi:cation:proton antiporter [Candidatus Parvarchaeota archaeon]|nr:cation:proton antiporter [Candidatus Parvarchaeota archaeon]
MEIIISILILLSVSLVVGQIFERFGFPSVIGQILSGVALGPALLGVVLPTASLTSISDISLFFIILLLGIEVTTRNLTSYPKQSSILSLSSFILPMVLMGSVAYFWFNLDLAKATIVSVAMAVPSISIVSVLLMKYGLVGTRDGDRILSSVVISDILAFIILSSVSRSLTIYSFIELISFISVFIVFILMIARALRKHSKIISRFFRSLSERKDGETAIFATVIILGLLIASLLQLIGITFVLGAFFAGILIDELVVGKDIFRKLIHTFRRIDESFFVPLFFSIAGATAILPNSSYIFFLLVMITMSSVISTLLTKLFSERHFDKLSVLKSMSLLGSRGAVGIIIASISLSSGIINLSLYSVIIFGTLLMSIIFPSLMRQGNYRRVK